jgi:hypothetical protein
VADKDIPTLSNPPTKEEALAYWISSVQLNADGTRKGGIFGSANLGIRGEAFIGDVINFDVVENTNKNTIIQVNSIETSTGTISCDHKAFACQEPSRQAVVDTPNFVTTSGFLWIFVIIRGLFTKSQGKVDYPSTDVTESVATAGGGFIDGNQTVAQAHDAETEQEGAKAKSASVMKTIVLPTRSDCSEEPRYCLFSLIGEDGTVKTFGMNRERVNHIQARYFGELPELPIMYKATDKTEVLAGFWMPVDEFLAISNDPNTKGRYVPWIAHQAFVRDAVIEIAK